MTRFMINDLKIRNIINTIVIFSICFITLIIGISVKNVLHAGTGGGDSEIGIWYGSLFFIYFLYFLFVILINTKIFDSSLWIKIFIFLLVSIFMNLLTTVYIFDIYTSKSGAWWGFSFNFSPEITGKYIFFGIRILFYFFVWFIVSIYISNFLVSSTIESSDNLIFINNNVWYLILNNIKYKVIDNRLFILKKDFVFAIIFLNNNVNKIQFNEEVKRLVSHDVNDLILEEDLQKEEYEIDLIEEDDFVKNMKFYEKQFDVKHFYNILLVNDQNYNKKESNFEIKGEKDVNLVIHNINKFKYWNKKILKGEFEIE